VPVSVYIYVCMLRTPPPAYLSYDPTAQPPRWASGDGSQVLQQDSAVRFRVILVEGQGAATQFGTLRGNYLGPLSS
jgi:DNA-directed RNA polymerase subunit E'/Rpb7